MFDLFVDSKLMKLTIRVGELVLLNLCYLLCCIPVVTAGAAAAALYTVCFRLGTPRERSVLSSFFLAFRSNLKQGTLLWLIALPLDLFSAGCALLFYSMHGSIHYAYSTFLVLLALCQVVFGYVFPLQSQFENTVARTLKNAAILSLGYLPRSVCIAAVNTLPMLLLFFDTVLFLRLGIVLIFLYFSAAAYANTFLLRKVFAPFLPEEEGEEDTRAPDIPAN